MSAITDKKNSCSRKRTYSGCSNNNNNTSNNNNNNNNNQAANCPNKKKKRPFIFNKRIFVPPTKFLLGGNIRDPLNLSGLAEDGEEKEQTGETKSEDKPEEDRRNTIPRGPHRFLLGGDINDPLNLKSIAEPEDGKCTSTDLAPISKSADNEQAQLKPQPRLQAPVFNNGPNYWDGLLDEYGKLVVHDETSFCSTSKLPAPTRYNESIEKRQKMLQQMQSTTDDGFSFNKRDKIVSPVVPQPYFPNKHHFSKMQIITPKLDSGEKTPRFKEQNTRFEYGNYNRYYGYRNTNKQGVDLRLEALMQHRDYFAGKDVLDVGCNIGHVSLIIARDFGAKSVTGIDIDRSLIEMAKKNIKYYVNCSSPYCYDSSPHPSTSPSFAAAGSRKIDLKNKCYPVSMPILYRSIHETTDLINKHGLFPQNITFVHGNYVLESDALLSLEQPQFDTIICLSITKWIHFNWGDDGLKRVFKRMFLQLRPGGILILEPQSWDSYTKKKRLTEKIWRNYHKVGLFPHHFDRYLLSAEVGFSRCQTITVINHEQKGFRRPLKMFQKAPIIAMQAPTIVNPDCSKVKSSPSTHFVGNSEVNVVTDNRNCVQIELSASPSDIDDTVFTEVSNSSNRAEIDASSVAVASDRDYHDEDDVVK